MRYLLAFVLAVVSLGARAQALPSYTGGVSGGTLYPGSMTDVGSAYRTYSPSTVLQGEVIMADKVRTSIGAASADMYVNRAISLRGALAMGARVLPLLNTASLLYSLYDGLGCHWVSGSMQCDGGLTPNSGPGYRYQNATNQSNPFYDTPYEVLVNSLSNGAVLLAWNCAPIPQGSSVNCYIKYRHINGTVYEGGIPVGYYLTTVKTCPDGSKVRADQLCNGGTVQTLSPEQAADKVKPYADPAKAVDVVKQAMGQGVSAQPYAETRPATGPATLTQPATTKTVTQPNGTTSVSTVTVTNNITYAGDTYNVTNTTVTNNPDGSTTTESQTPDKDPCDLNPTALACIKLGEPPSDMPTWQTKSIAYQADNLGLSGACPAPWTGTVHGWSLSMSYQPVCDVAPQIRHGVLALASLGALLMIITTVRT